MTKRFMHALLGAAIVVGGVSSFAPAHAQDAREIELSRTQQLCSAGNRRECIHFGMLLQQNRDRHEAWRRSHPEFFAWERW